MYHLGEEYDLPRVKERINENFDRYGAVYYNRNFNPLYQQPKFLPFQPAQKKTYVLKGSLKSTKKIGGLRGLYLHYCYLMGIYPKEKQHRPLSPQMREEWRKIDEYSRRVRLICSKKLKTVEDVQGLIDSNTKQLAELKAQRDKCYNRPRRCDDPQKKDQIKTGRSALTEQMTKLRKENKTAGNIISEQEKMRENMQIERAFIAAKREREQPQRRKNESNRGER